MAHQGTPLGRESLQSTLALVLDHAADALAPYQWRLVGTGAALLHGVDLPTGDIDFLVRERAAVDAFAAAMAPFHALHSPAWLESARQYYAAYLVNGAQVDISTVEAQFEGDHSECIGSGPWERYSLLPCGGYQVPTVSLELRLLTDLLRRRPERYERSWSTCPSTGRTLAS